MIFDVYGIENNLATLQTTIKFRVWEQLTTLRRLKDDCSVVLDGRYDIDDEGLQEQVELIYNEEILNAGS